MIRITKTMERTAMFGESDIGGEREFLILLWKYSSTGREVLQYWQRSTPVLAEKYSSTGEEVLACHTNRFSRER